MANNNGDASINRNHITIGLVTFVLMVAGITTFIWQGSSIVSNFEHGIKSAQNKIENLEKDIELLKECDEKSKSMDVEFKLQFNSISMTLDSINKKLDRIERGRLVARSEIAPELLSE